jgi:hypothetical protein
VQTLAARQHLVSPRAAKVLIPAATLANCIGVASIDPTETPAMNRRLFLAQPKRSDEEKKAIEQVTKLGGTAMELAQNDPRLEVAYHLGEGKFTAEHLAALKPLKQLVHLNLRGREVTDDMLASLKDLTALIRLHLEKTKVTDKGLVHLKGLVNLEYLNLYGTAVGDAGLAHLEGMKKLKSLYLWETKVTDPGVEKLKKALPQLTVVRGVEAEKPKTTSEAKPEEKKPPEKKDEKKPPEKK